MPDLAVPSASLVPLIPEAQAGAVCCLSVCQWQEKERGSREGDSAARNLSRSGPEEWDLQQRKCGATAQQVESKTGLGGGRSMTELRVNCVKTSVWKRRGVLSVSGCSVLLPTVYFPLLAVLGRGAGRLRGARPINVI